jgi:hypothetical protein
MQNIYKIKTTADLLHLTGTNCKIGNPSKISLKSQHNYFNNFSI